ncbi:MAG: exodeoxyribonuclease VII small subunit [Bdellovibrionales bacterium]|nr:exodeoxyribonuclease VII small subunit [Bdellovibrionales bacterium]NQZ19353.1 exodeoxyribonuclease VII small subunit [Bdellovibrionales bacterium]
MSFEKKLTRLEEIVQKMEAGELNLDDSLKLFEEGVKLSRECNKELNTAEQKVKKLIGVNDQGEPILENFEGN